MKKIKVVSIFGTRPEVIKMAPVVKEFSNRESLFDSKIILTGQHEELCQPYLKLFSIEPDYNLKIMEKNQTLNLIVVKILSRLPPLLLDINPDVVLVQGDTSSAFAAALAAFHNKTSIGHIEAGLRTGNKYNPYPEEKNRHLIGTIADFHFSPTLKTRQNLLAEGVREETIFVTGNTVIDALFDVLGKKSDYAFTQDVLKDVNFNNKIITVTTHRRESIGEPMYNVLFALKRLTELYPDVEVILPVHYNPNVRKQVNEVLGETKKIHLIEPLDYEPFVHLMSKSYMMITDSGGIQEEAPSLGKPVLVVRDTTERPEGVEAGTAKLIGTDKEKIIAAASLLLEDKTQYERMANAVNPYGDGTAAKRIADVLYDHFAQ